MSDIEDNIEQIISWIALVYFMAMFGLAFMTKSLTFDKFIFASIVAFCMIMFTLLVGRFVFGAWKK